MNRYRRAALGVMLLALVLLAGACMAGKIHPGRSLLRKRCSSCHLPRSADSLRQAGFDKVVADHGDKLKLKPDEAEQMRAYLEGKQEAAAGK